MTPEQHKREADYAREFAVLLELAGWGAGMALAVFIGVVIVLRLV